MSSYLKSVSLRNYRSIRGLNSAFKPGINIIIGNNGTGKTNFLKLVYELINPFDSPQVGSGCEIVLVSEQEFKISFKKNLSGKENDLFFSATGKTEISIDVATGAASVSANKLKDALDKLDYGQSYYWPIPIWHGSIINNMPIISENSDLTIDNNGLLNMRGAPSIIKMGILLLTEILSVVRMFFVSKKSDIFSIEPYEIKRVIEQTISSFLITLNDYLATYSPIQSIRLSEFFQVYRNQPQDELIIKGLVLEYRINGSWFPFSALSDGTKRLFYIISQLALPILIFSNANESNIKPLYFKKIFLIEEPELGIHPDQLQKLLSLIREVSKEHQVIMTTHSPQVLNMLTTKELDRITICALDPEKGTQFRKLSPAKRAKAKAYMQNDSYLSDFWLYSNLEAE